MASTAASVDKARLASNLKAARVGAGLSQASAAIAVGKSRQTIVNWENPDATPVPDEAELGLLAKAYGVPAQQLRYGQIIRGAIVTGHAPQTVSGTVSETLHPVDRVDATVTRHARNLPLSVREYLHDFRGRLLKAGATDEQIEEAMDLFRAPQVFTLYVGGAMREFTEDDVLANIRTLAEESVIPTLRRRGLKL